MLIVSWNVAGLSQTVKRIDSSYGNPTMRRKSPSAVIGEFLQRHQADIFCVQESKIPLAQLESRSEPLQCAHIAGYESFWSCCVDTSKRGFNGVTTYVKTGLVCKADSRPLGSNDLDDQGRCVMTDHGRFVVFNVYVPAGGGQPLSYKMKFLNALRRAMKNQRKQNKEVMLVGDLNISHTELDVFWGSRCIDVNKICSQVREATTTTTTNRKSTSSSEESDLPKWKIDLCNTWGKIENILECKKVIPVQTTNPRTKETFEKYRMSVQLEGKQILLGGHEESPHHCEYDFDFDAAYYTCAETDETILAQEENMISISTLAELMGKLGGVEWDLELQRKIAKSDGVRGYSPPRAWLSQIIQEDKMVDTFRHFYPDAEARFTIWDQFRNRRYANQGARIDFALIDESLLTFLRKGDVPSLRCGCTGKHDPNSEEAALCAATAGGKFQAVSFEGGGIIEPSQHALDSQFGERHSGLIYTPPSFSDHIAVSLLLDDGCCSNDPRFRNKRRQDKSSPTSQEGSTNQLLL